MAEGTSKELQRLQQQILQTVNTVDPIKKTFLLILRHTG